MEVHGFDSTVPLESASTPPSAWYTDPGLYALERERVFAASWQFAARGDQLTATGNYVAGLTAGAPWLVLRHPDGGLRAFHNVCRHHAAEVCSGAGTLERLICPYHRWTYDLDGHLSSAPELGGARDFDRADFSLPPMSAETFAPFVFVSAATPRTALADELAELRRRLDAMGTAGLRFVRRLSYVMQCNWKVFVDNYLDGGYHIEHLHHGLAAELDLRTYRTELFSRLSIQSSGGGQGDRVDWGALYAFVHPNFMINRYGPWMDTNLVLPLGPDRCEVVMDYWLDEKADAGDEFIERSLVTSQEVHAEDVAISESVQRGVSSPSYERGRYSAAREGAMHLFHCNLAADLARIPSVRI